MELLRNHEGTGPPREYLLARISGRSCSLVGDWEALLAADDPLAALDSDRRARGGVPGVPGGDAEIWCGLQRELAWLHDQMDQATRSVFAPLFLFFELRTVVLCLRRRLSGDRGRCGELLRHSLLGRELQGVLLAECAPPAVVGGLCRLFAGTAKRFERLAPAFRERGVAGFEELLTTVYLEEVAKGPLHPVLGGFLGRLIDLRNALVLAKQRRWRVPLPPVFIEGGTIEVRLWRQAAGEDEGRLAGALVRRLAGSGAELAAGNLESLLFGGLTRLVGKNAREPEGIGRIIAYTWRLELQARNLSLLVHGSRLDRGLLAGELIR